MIASDFRIEPADFRADFDDLRNIRTAVFVEEQNIPEDIEFDALDPHCHHVVARDTEHRAIGTGRLSENGGLGRMAVLPAWRKRGVGTALLSTLIDKARQLGLETVTLHAQTATLGFYRRFGFVDAGEAPTVAGIAHRALHLTLQPLAIEATPAPIPRGPSVAPLGFDTLEATLAATVELVESARRGLCIVSRDLEFGLYGQAPAVEALKQFALRSREGTVRILLQDTTPLRSTPHPVMELAQRLPSSFLLRVPVDADDLQYPSAFIANDRDGFLFRLVGERYQGIWSPAQAGRNRQLTEIFEQMWQRALPCTEFRKLGI